MKTLWICGLLFLLSLVAFGRISVALSGTGEPRSETRAAPSPAALPPALSDYVLLHETRNASIPLQIAARANGCGEMAREVRR